jgi:hypothetical protein
MRTWIAAGLVASSILAFAAPESPSARSPQAAQPSIDAKLYAGLRWRSIGPARGGR